MPDVIRKEFRAVSYDDKGEDPFRGSIQSTAHEAHVALAHEWDLKDERLKNIKLEEREVRETEWAIRC